jgi:uncharacterized SAM-binding protein YcdF (DUF218 family)
VFFWFSKILEFLFSPLTWIIIALVMALLQRKPVRRKRWLIVSLIMAFVFTNSFLATEAIRFLEISKSDMKQDTVYDAAILLGGGMITFDKDEQQFSFRVNTDRYLQALALFHEGKVKNLLISGGSGSMVFRDMSEASLLYEFSGKLGFDTTRIIYENESDNTYQNAKFSMKILQDSLPGEHYLLITSASHMRRAAAVFRKAGLTFDMYPTNPIAGKRRNDPYFLIMPSSSALIIWETFFKETIGYVVYKIAGYL